MFIITSAFLTFFVLFWSGVFLYPPSIVCKYFGTEVALFFCASKYNGDRAQGLLVMCHSAR